MKLSLLTFFLGTLAQASNAVTGDDASPRIHNNLKSRDECSTPKKDTCTFYKSCLEAAVTCGPDGYAIAYGDPNCNKLTPLLDDFSDEGRVWVSDVRYCLQEKLVPYATGQKEASCEAIKEHAFATHPACFIDNGLCTLPPSDWLVILRAIGVEGIFGNKDVFIAAIKSASECADFYFWLVGDTVIGMEEDWDVIMAGLRR
ncbi:hypothetical protein FQN49_003232 [Arthroderma sp. PD_2]|nr:hypothetical protein FQN49_003232 [Arthroderma sp. PD_2]